MHVCVLLMCCFEGRDGCGGKKEAWPTKRQVGVIKVKKGVEWVQSTQSGAMVEERKQSQQRGRSDGLRKLKKGVEWVQSTQSRAMASLEPG